MEAAGSESRELQMSLLDWKKVFEVCFPFLKSCLVSQKILKVFQDSEQARWCLCGFFFRGGGRGVLKNAFLKKVLLTVVLLKITFT